MPFLVFASVVVLFQKQDADDKDHGEDDPGDDAGLQIIARVLRNSADKGGADGGAEVAREGEEGE